MSMFMFQNKFCTLTSFFLLIGCTCFGQLSTSFSFGGIVSSERSVTSYTGPMIVNGGKCFTVSNGVNTLYAKDSIKGEFSDNCKVIEEPVSTISYSCYPNPINSFTTIVAKGKVDYKQKYTLSICNNFGQIVYHTTGTMDQLAFGKTISFEKLGIGFYIIRIVSENNTTSVFKVIKGN